MSYAPGNSQSPQSNTGAGVAILLLATFCFFGIIFMWHFRHNDIVYLWLRFDRLIALPFRSFSEQVNETILLLKAMNSRINIVTFRDMLDVTSSICIFYLPIAILLCLYGIYRGWNQPISKLRMTYTAEMLLQRLNRVFPYTSPILDKDLLNFDDPKWRSAMPPYKFAIRNGILQDRSFKAIKAKKVFEKQVGRPFKSVTDLRPHEKALMAVFMALIDGDVTGGRKILDELARTCLKTGEPNYQIAYNLFAQHKGQIKKFLRVNKYVTTMLCSMFEASKIRGMITPSMFLWLKPVDRTLWYGLNRVGAQTPFVEAAGIWNQWKAEQVSFTGRLPISDWFKYFTKDPISGKLKWDEVKPAFELAEIYIEDAVRNLESMLFECGLVDKMTTEGNLNRDNKSKVNVEKPEEETGLKFA